MRQARHPVFRIVLAALLSLSILSPLVSQTPVQAFEAGIFNPPSGFLDSPYSFVVIATSAIPPAAPETTPTVINAVSVSIYKDGERSRWETRLDLPVMSSVRTYTPALYVGRPVTAIAYVDKSRTYAYYSILWTAPADYPQGRYRIEAVVVTSQNTFTRTSAAFPLQIFVPPGRLTDFVNMTDDAGVLKKSMALQSPDATLNLNILQGTRAVSDNGTRVAGITIVPVTTPPPVPSGATLMGDAYEIGPPKAGFSPPASLSITYRPAIIPAGFTERNLVIGYFDMARESWVMLPDSVTDPATLTVTAPVSRFALYTLMTHRFPASFAISGLAIDPQRVTAGESTNVTVTVTNRGDFSGSYEAALIVDDGRYDARSITVGERASGNVTFEVTKTTLGVHKVQAGTMTGSFTVLRAPPPTRTPPPTTAAAPTASTPPPKPSAAPKPPPPSQFTPSAIPMPAPPPTVSEWVVVASFLGIVALSMGVWWFIRSRQVRY